MKIEQIHAKSLMRHAAPSIFSWAEIYLNPYQGCYHNCVYCDGKSEYYHMQEDFGDHIKVKINAPQLFSAFLKSKGFNSIHHKEQSNIYDFFPSLISSSQKINKVKSIINIGGGVCDVYQQPEEEIKITRRLLEIVHDYQMPLWILTKNKLVLRDLDIIKEINKETYACVNFTITLANEQVQKIFEPRASTTNERFEAIKTLRKEGIHSGVYFYPALPFIGDTNGNIQSIYKRAKDVGAEFVYCWGLTLKPGRSKNEFMEVLKKHFPEIHAKYEVLYGNNDKYGNLDKNQIEKFGLIWPEIKGFKYGYELGMGYAAERYVPEGRIEANLKLSELLRKIINIKRFILHESSNESQSFSKAAELIEKTFKDVSKLKKEEFNDLPITKNVQLIIQEFLNKGKSQYLIDLEKKAYDHIQERFFSS